jgi:ATP-dependent DNA helicase RecQ
MQQLRDLLKIHYGYSGFRLAQERAIQSILDGRDTLVIMPTGGGKSLIYQLPALALPGVTIVVSPLIALMKDQVDQLEQAGIPATFINSSLAPHEVAERLEAIRSGLYKLLYIAPERFYSQQFTDMLQEIEVSLFAIDEAHCISEWGHDFRPSYMRLRHAIEHIGRPPIVALTATATPEVKEDIARQLNLNLPEILVSGFDRPNLKFGVIKARDPEKYMHILDIAQSMDGAGVIYAGTRQKVEGVLEHLLHNGVEAVGYHAGIDSSDRKRVQDDFMTGRARVIVATNAFGLGVNKPDIRFVVHFDIPGTIESYYQEAGRAGRDGKESFCILLHSPADRYLREFFIKGDNPPPSVVRDVYEIITEHDDDSILITYGQLMEGVREQVPDMAIGTAVKILEKEGYLRRATEKNGRAFVQFLHPLPHIKNSLSKKAKTQHAVFDALARQHGDALLEGVNFAAEELADLARVKRDAVNRLMKKLQDDGFAEYQPPFRGTEIQILKRVEPDTLDIDFDALTAKYKRELNKLDLMEGYVYDFGCRRQYILDYFQDNAARSCGNCDNCQNQSSPTPSATSDLPTISADDIVLETKLPQLATYELYQQGYDIADMAQRRNVKPGTIVQHLVWLTQNGKGIDIAKFVDAKKQKVIKKAAKKYGVKKLSPIKEACGDDVTWDEIRLTAANL